MIQHISTFNSYNKYENEINNNHSSMVVENLDYQTSTLSFKKQIDDCKSYDEFLNELKQIQNKVKKGDLSVFTELKL